MCFNNIDIPIGKPKKFKYGDVVIKGTDKTTEEILGKGVNIKNDPINKDQSQNNK